jgi:N-acetyl-anhydromuramoyl-L-alanine amidase
MKVKPAMPAFPEERLQSPNVSATPIRPSGVVFHHSCGTWAGDTSWILNPASKVSYHCLINAKGERRVFAGDTQRAWHAGKSNWRGRADCNSFMLGVAFSGDTYPTRKFGRLLTDLEIRSALDWLAPRIQEHALMFYMLTDHRNVSPGRKDDLNPSEWLRLQRRIKERFYS